MPIELTSDQRGLADASRSYLSTASSSQVVHALAMDGPTLDRSYWRQLAELGWTSMLVPEESGGGSLSDNPYHDLAVVADLSGRSVAPGPLVPANIVASALSRGSGELVEQTLQGVMAGELVPAWAVAEGLGSFTPGEIRTTATHGEGGWVLDGRKEYVESAVDADVFLVVARDSDGLVQLLVDRDADGVSVEPKNGLDPSRTFGSLVLDNVSVDDAARVGADGAADAEVAHLLDVAVAIQAAETVGLMDHVFEMTMDWVQQRVAFGRTIGSYQALKHRLADHKLWLEASHGLVDGLGEALGAGDDDATRIASLAKAHIGDYALVLIQDAIQMHGGIGVTWEHDLHLYLRRATTNRALFGSPIQHRERLCTLAGI
jgi:alkylation response protein AidB-like acyl-CoA dehydrogenase